MRRRRRHSGTRSALLESVRIRASTPVIALAVTFVLRDVCSVWSNDDDDHYRDDSIPALYVQNG